MSEESTRIREPSRDKLTQVEAVCLERWGSVPSSRDESTYHITESISFPTELDIAVSRLYQNSTFQSLSDEEKHQALQDLVWFVNDKWSGWQWSSHRDLIIDVLQETDLATELDYEYVIRIGEETFINSQYLEGAFFPADMFRARNHLRDGEMAILIPKNGVIGVAHASAKQHILTIMDIPTEDNILQQRYHELARQMRDLVDLEVRIEMLQRALRERQVIEAPNLTESEQLDESTQNTPEASNDEFESIDSSLKILDRIEDLFHSLKAIVHKRRELSTAYRAYVGKAAFALTDLVERHKSKAVEIIEPDGRIQPNAIRALVRLSRRFQGDLDRMRAEGVTAVDFLAPMRLLTQVQLRVGPLPPAVLVKISNEFGKLYLQTIYDCLHEAGANNFENSVKFVMLKAEDALPLPMVLDEEPPLDDQSFEESKRALLDLITRVAPASFDVLLKVPKVARVDISSHLIEALAQTESQEEALLLAFVFCKLDYVFGGLGLGSEGIRSLIAALGHDNQTVHKTAFVALIHAGISAIPFLSEGLGSQHAQGHTHIRQILVHIGNPSMEQLLSTLSSSDTYQRAGAMVILSALNDKNHDVLWNSVEDSTILRFAADLVHPDAYIRTAVMGVLNAIKSRAIDLFIERLENENKSKKIEELSAALKAIGEPAIAVLIQHLEQIDNSKIFKSVLALGMIGKPAVESLIQHLKESDESNVIRLTLALARIGEPAVESLIQHLKESDESNVIRLTLALARIGEPAVDSLIAMLSSSSEKEVSKASAVLLFIGEAAIEPLETLLEIGNTQQREMASIVLEAIEKRTQQHG